MNDGKFVDDEIINKIIKNIIFDPKKTNKLIFDGYPRSLTQAKNLDIMLNDTNQKIDFIFFLNVDKNTIIKRIEKRKIIENRSDDNLEAIKTRQDKYFSETHPLAAIFKQKFEERFFEINATQEITKIQSDIENRLKNA